VERTLLVSDTHLGIYNASDFWHDVVLKVFEIITDFCHKNDIKRIIHLGDFFDNRKSISLKSLFYAVEHIAPLLNQFETYIIVGNHDTFYKNQIKPHSLVIFNKFENIHVIDESTVIDNDIGVVPWNDKLVLGVPYLIGHFEINDFRMNEGFVMRNARLNKDDMGPYKQVLSGHYHTPMKDKNITYLGAPFQQSFADVGGERGFYLWSKSRELEFFAIKDAPQFLRITADQSIIKSEIPNIKGNIVKLIFEQDFGTSINEKIVESIQMHKPQQLFTDFSKISKELAEDERITPDTTTMVSNKEIVEEFINKSTVPKNIEKKTVMSMISKIIDSIVEDK
jgi:DNA repair exonuclease SbcCD nuclease subunit